MSRSTNVQISDVEVAANCMCTKLRAGSRAVTRHYENVMKAVGLSANQFSILIAVSIMAPVSITRLAQQLSMERTTLTRNLRPLENEGMILLTDGHGRTRELSLTKKGQETLKEAKPLWDQAQRQLIEQLGKRDTQMLSELLRSILKTEITT